MKLGISTASLYPLETEIALEEIAKQGVTATEIFYNSDIERKNYFTDLAANIKESYGINITALHPMLSFAEPYMIFSEYTRRFDQAQDDFNHYFETAASLGAKFINLHGDRPNGKLSVEEYCERFGILAEKAKSFGVTLCQENVNGYRSADPEFLREMNNQLGHLANFTLDIKQCIRAGYTVTEIIDSMGENICHVHISDHGVGGDCLLPGNGGFNFRGLFELFAQKNYKGAFLIEVYRNAYKEPYELFESYKILKKQNNNLFE
ncbi:MAG: sugar phosphate isomerase/epimerase [Clostridia bacterium]|nr:sugar phosphate isomerase/epimerase [Clostridia bacterium]